MRWVSGALALLVASLTATADDFVHDFRKSAFKSAWFRFNPDDADQYITPEDEGLRWKLEPGKAPGQAKGIAWQVPIAGDFAITARYEIMRADPPGQGRFFGATVELYLMIDNPGKPVPQKEGIVFTRTIEGAGPIVRFRHLYTNEEGKRVSRVVQDAPTTAATERGRLRLVRQGTTLAASFAEQGKDDFIELARTEVDAVPIRMCRFGGQSGDPNAALDMRLLEFALTGPEVAQGSKQTGSKTAKMEPGDASGKQGDATGTREEGGGGLLWIVAGVGALAIAVIGVVLLRPRSPAAKGGVSVTLVCPACGKKLRVHQNRAGGSIKCPACGEAIQVPA